MPYRLYLLPTFQFGLGGTWPAICRILMYPSTAIIDANSTTPIWYGSGSEAAQAKTNAKGVTPIRVARVYEGIDMVTKSPRA